MDKKPIFIYKHPLAFMWSGGRLCILSPEEKMIDLGDGGMSKGKFGHTAKIDHWHLGDMHCNDTIFNFRKYNLIFDFNDLQNAHFLEKNKVKNKRKSLSYTTWHFNRFFEKHYKINNGT